MNEKRNLYRVLDITIYSRLWSEDQIFKKKFLYPALTKIIYELLSFFKINFKPKSGIFGLVLADDSYLNDLNKQFRNKDKPTNVLSFPYIKFITPLGSDRREKRSPLKLPREMIGDIMISYQRTIEEAKELGVSPLEHFSFLVLHGLLHLLGYDHITEEEGEIMGAIEKSIMKSLNYPDYITKMENSWKVMEE